MVGQVDHRRVGGEVCRVGGEVCEVGGQVRPYENYNIWVK